MHGIKEELLASASKRLSRQRSSLSKHFAFTPAYAPPEYLLECLKKQTS